MQFRILKKQVDEAGNVGYIFDEDFEGTEDEVITRLVLLNSTEGYEHVAECDTETGVAILVAPII